MAMQILILSYSFHITFLSFTKIENFDSETSIIIYQHPSIFKLKNLNFFLICSSVYFILLIYLGQAKYSGNLSILFHLLPPCYLIHKDIKYFMNRN